MKLPGKIARLWIGLAIPATVTVVGVLSFINSDRYRLQGPNAALYKLDLFFLNEPAPYAVELNIARDMPTLILFCEDCHRPELDGPVKIVQTNDAKIAKAYRMIDGDSNVGEGYALIDTTGNVRYRTYDPQPELHTSEINKLIKNLP